MIQILLCGVLIYNNEGESDLIKKIERESGHDNYVEALTCKQILLKLFCA